MGKGQYRQSCDTGRRWNINHKSVDGEEDDGAESRDFRVSRTFTSHVEKFAPYSRNKEALEDFMS